ncbi:hypothetical protein C9374_012622 [Naegleria lovaniensis]|uniref:Cytochrome P450 n=1 Tax=Naegleria lovaniensis TaxID=51637 RepID=A0AA88H023_NAELO|nr:uncharacterized protein C9374_012622 [Naegleria lovaniensis]KAG2392370.1 hypothetical protein C9374_012622 [Naegleria lovaniensis]
MTLLDVVFAVTLVLVAIVLFCAFSVYNNYRHAKHIPGVWQLIFAPFKIPIISDYVYFGSHETIQKLIREKGDPKTQTVRVSLMSRNAVIISDKNLLKELLIVKGNNFIKPIATYDAFNVFGPNILSILDANSEAWKNHHRVASGAFASKNLEYMSTVASNSVDLIRSTKWDKEIEASKTRSIMIDSNSDFSDITLDVLGKAGFGLDFSIFDQVSKEGRNFRNALEIMFTKGIILRRFILPNALLSWTLPYLSKWMGVTQAHQVVSKKLDEIIHERRKEMIHKGDSNVTSDSSSDERKDLLSILVEANINEKGLLNDEELKSDAFIFSLAGHETTSTALQWTCYELAKRPHIQQHVREEIDALLGKGLNARSPNYDHYPHLNYVNAVIMESMRIHPPVTQVVRVTKKTTQVGDIVIPKDTGVLVSIFSANRSERNWDRPEEFIPERFPMNYEEQAKIQHDFAWLPFSAGNRKCIGFKFALIEACIILSRLLQFYTLELGNDESNPNDQVTDVKGVTVRPGNLKLILKHRTDL